MILENTNTKVHQILQEFGGDNPERLLNMLQSLVTRVEMDIHNEFNRRMSDVQLEIRRLPMPDED